MKIGIVLQARTNSTRLPQKMILPFYDKMGILETILIRLKKNIFDIPIIVATTTNECDNIIEKICTRHNIQTFRGKEEDVLNRFIETSMKFNLEKMIRICCDNPFLDISALIKQIISFEKSDNDYWCYCKSDQTPTIKTHYGFWGEGVTAKALMKINEFTSEKHYHEHVTNYIYTNKSKFNIHFETIHKNIEESSNIRLTIDTMQDFVLAKQVYRQLLENKIEFEAKKIIEYLTNKHDWIVKMKNEIELNTK